MPQLMPYLVAFCICYGVLILMSLVSVLLARRGHSSSVIFALPGLGAGAWLSIAELGSIENGSEKESRLLPSLVELLIAALPAIIALIALALWRSRRKAKKQA